MNALPSSALPRVASAYHLEGSQGAPFLVLANSLGATPAMWDLQLPVWRRHFQVLRYSYRGHGATPATASPLTVTQLADDLLSLLDDLKIQCFDVVGLSLGGMLGLHLAASVPHRVNRLVAANCRYFQTDESRQQWDQRIGLVRSSGTPAIADGTVDRWLTAAGRERLPEPDARLREMVRATGTDGYASCAAAVRDFDAHGLLDRIKAPTLLIAGSEDLAAPPEHMQALATSIAGSRYLELPAAHLSNIECADRFTQAVLEFLGTRRDGRNPS